MRTFTVAQSTASDGRGVAIRIDGRAALDLSAAELRQLMQELRGFNARNDIFGQADQVPAATLAEFTARKRGDDGIVLTLKPKGEPPVAALLSLGQADTMWRQIKDHLHLLDPAPPRRTRPR